MSQVCRFFKSTGQPKIEKLDIAFGGDPDVFGFDVAMQVASLVSVSQSFCNLDGELFGRRRIELSFDVYFVTQRLPLEKLHD